ncbi:RagB/SusD family nutrient uptake outer membrane protein [Maribacter algarum]|uniref:RagB/SusD family nutrient uptake outer membrane protein n=1 Tax=Maribacter algarum (ex Zhang et al. 2020) TaxID=2578118 RepID=A0A5S3PWB4_9FLAO|nr:RagB/SusD family nutrient uptake outer membrane protein [Maribacter algarum]TMM58502.1 RagB/SusD family nutrient uptake outer membrane protein [Maribacter algarum]
MKKNLLKFASLIVFGLLLVGCNDDFLETQPLSQASDVSVWSDVKLAEAAVLDLYQGTWAGTLTREETTDAFTDQAVFTHPGRGVDGYTEGKMNPAGNFMDMQWFSWPQIYPFIRNANIAISRLTANEAGFDQAFVDQMLGEAYFMRAYYYTQLMRQFGGVVLLTEPLDLDSEANNPRGTFEETVNLILADIAQAETLLADAPASKQRAHLLTAMALKSRVLTHVASDLYEPSKASSVATIASYSNPELIGWTGGSQEQRWQAAKAASKALLDATTGYKLDYTAPAARDEAIQNYEDIWLQGDENQDYIWGRSVEEFGFGSRTYPGGDGWSQGPGMVALYHGPNGYHEWAGTTPTEALVSKYSMADGTPFDWDNPAHAADPYTNRDPRFYATILYDGGPWKQRTDDVVKFDKFNELQTGFYTLSDGTIINGVDTRQGPIEDWNGSRTGYYFRKFADPRTPASWPNDLQKVDAPYIRYTEVLLNYVEASLNTSDEGEAVAWLNKLRFRNGMPAVTESGSALVDLYKNERNIELVNEDARLFDMKRWMEGPESLNKPVQQILIQATQKAGTPAIDPGDYRKDPAMFDYVYRPTDIVFENRIWQDHVYFMPIKQEEIDKDPSIIQNPGY